LNNPTSNIFTYQTINQRLGNNLIPNTTNSLDGGVITKIKELVRNHRGMNLQRRNKLIVFLLNSIGKDDNLR
jgi:hypothetical protein